MSDDFKPLSRAVGSWHENMQKLGFQNKVDYKVECKRNGFKGAQFVQILRYRNAPRPTKLAAFSEANGWQVQQAEWDTLGTQKTVEQLYASLSS